MNKDTTNTQNIKMFFLGLFSFFVCILLIAIIGILFGMKQFNPISNFYDRPASTFCFHDHRI